MSRIKIYLDDGNIIDYETNQKSFDFLFLTPVKIQRPNKEGKIENHYLNPNRIIKIVEKTNEDYKGEFITNIIEIYHLDELLDTYEIIDTNGNRAREHAHEIIKKGYRMHINNGINYYSPNDITVHIKTK